MTKHSQNWARRFMVILIAIAVVFTYMPQELYTYAASKASVYDGRTLKGSDGKPYYPNQKDDGYYWAKFSNKAGSGFVYRKARATSAKKLIMVNNGKTTYQGYCLEHGAWMNAGATGYSAEEQESLMEMKWMDPYSEDALKGMRLALLFGKQPGMTAKDVPVEGCTLDDWYWATQNIIWEFQQGVRKSVTSGLASRTGKYPMDKNWFKDTVKGRPAEKIYNWMLSQMKKYEDIPSFTAKKVSKIRSQHTINMEKQADGTWLGTTTDMKGIGHDIKSTNKSVKIVRSGNTYTITSSVDPATITKPIKAVKNLEVSNPNKDLLVWTTNQDSPVADSNHLQTVATGADDPVEMFFKLKAAGDADAGEPELPSFELDVEKFDKNTGFDGNNGTGMGDAALDATIDLVVGGDVYDSMTLDVYGKSDAPFYFMPWEDVSELTKTEVPTYDDNTGALLYTDYYWRGTKTVKTVESGIPDGRLPDANGGERSHGTISYYAHQRDDGAIDYNITFENGTLTNAADVSPDNPQAMLDDKDGRAYVNDNFRGQLQIIKTKTDLDPFTPNNGSGKLDYSTASKWTIRLDSDGYEDCPYIRVVPLTSGESGYSAFANNYKVVRDSAGTPADRDNPLTVSKYGQINIVDLPYGNYVVEEISADSNGYVLESHTISVTEDGQLISTDTNNVPKKNKVQVVKVNSETGKTVRLDENSSFRIKYLGNPDLADPTLSTNYGKYLPNGSSYTDGGESGKNNYIFKCNQDGQIVLPYELEYGIYQLEEITVPDGYFVGQYDENGVGTSTDMPKKFEDAVVIYDSAGDKVKDFTNNDKIIFNKYKFTVNDQTPHKDGTDYVTYYLTVKMQNNPVKGKIEIAKSGESLAGWLKANYGGNSGYSAVWDKTKLKGATFNVYAAEDIYQVDEVQRIKAFNASDDKEIELEEVTRDHADTENATSFWQWLRNTGEKILRWIGIETGADNECKTEYIAKADKGATYTTKYSKKENGITTEYEVDYSVSYTKGGMNYTNIHVKKVMTADDYVAALDVTDPSLKSGNDDVDLLNLILPSKNMVKLNKETVNEYGKSDVEAKIVMPVAVISPMDLSTDPTAPDGWTLVKKSNKYLAEKEVQDENEDGSPKVDGSGDPVMITIYQIYVDDNGSKKWIDCDDAGDFDDKNTPKDLPKDYTKTTKTDMFQVSKTTPDGTVYKVWTNDGWVDCDEDGNFYKSHTQEYDITLTQHFDCADGWEFSFDGLIVDALADNDAQTAKTLVVNPFGATTQITASSGYTYKTEGKVTTFDAAPKNLAPVYFKVNSGIKTSMIYQGGHTVTTMLVKQSQLYYFGADSKPEDTTSTEKIYPMIEYTTAADTELIEWCKDLDPNNTTFERVIDENNFIKVTRHEVDAKNDEVYYEVNIISDNKDKDKGFKVTYPDTTTMQPVIGIDDKKDAGKLIFTSIEGTMMYPMGSPVATITTDENGIATTPNLPLGKYWIQEVTSGKGHVNGGEWKEFNLTYADQYTPLIWGEASLDNDAVSVKIDLQKLLESAYESGEYYAGGGAVFGVFSAEEITATTKTEKKVDTKTIDADTLVGTIAVQSNGNGTTVAKLPLGKYYVKEIAAPSGYKLNGSKYYFDAVDILTADEMTFAYKTLGISGSVTQDGNNNVIVDIDALYKVPATKLTIDGTTYPMDKDTKKNNVEVSVKKGRTNTQIKLTNGKSTTIKFENGASIVVSASGQTYKAVVSGAAPSTLETGADGNDNFTVSTVSGVTTINYSPKVTKTTWLTEAVYKYVEPKEDADKTKVTELELTSPEGTSKVAAKVDYEYGKAILSYDKSKVTSITHDGNDVTPIGDTLTLERIVRTPSADPDGEPTVDVNATKAVISFTDGVSYTVEFDAVGNFYMSASAVVDKNLATESTLTVDGSDSLPKTVTIKNTTAKTYARNNTKAGVINVTVNGIKNDRLPNVPVTPAPKGSIEITKVDNESGKTLTGAEFEIWTTKVVNGKTVKDTLIHTGATGSDGKLVVSDLDYGTYYYHETVAPEGYAVDNAYYPVEVSAGHVVAKVTMDNKKIAGDFELTKTDEDTGKVLGAAEFNILNSEKLVIYSGKTNIYGKLKIKDLAPGTYYYQETKAPYGYELDSKLYKFEITTKTTIVKKTMTNKLKVGFVDLDTDKNGKVKPDGSVDLNNGNPKTGDSSNMALYVILLLIATSGALGFAGTKSKKGEDE
ncbi:hypothetical protein M2140_001779 [Clostridiales Family XIII bacterium PM5-7]